MISINLKKMGQRSVLLLYLLFYFYYYSLAVAIPLPAIFSILTTIEFVFTLALLLLVLFFLFCSRKLRVVWFFVVLLAWCILILFHSLFGNNLFVDIRQYLHWVILIFVLYRISQINDEYSSTIFISVFAIAMSILHLIYGLGIKTVQQINSVYFIFLLQPLLFVSHKKGYTILQVLGIILSTIACILSNKGVIFLGYAIFILLILLFYFNRQKLVLSFLIFIALLIYVLKSYLNTDVFNLFLASFDDGGNGRVEIYASCLRLFKGAGLISKIIGCGNGYVSSILNIGAHNEYLETLVDYGLLGFVMYSFVSIYCYVLCFKCFRIERSLFYLAFVSMYSTTSLFSTLCFSYSRVLFYCLSIVYLYSRYNQITIGNVRRNCRNNSRKLINVFYEVIQ